MTFRQHPLESVIGKSFTLNAEWYDNMVEDERRGGTIEIPQEEVKEESFEERRPGHYLPAITSNEAETQTLPSLCLTCTHLYWSRVIRNPLGTGGGFLITRGFLYRDMYTNNRGFLSAA